MTTPCIQGPTIDKMDEKLDQVILTLQTLAVQKNEMEHIVKGQSDHHSWLKGHEVRIQILERTPGNIASKFLWLLVGAMITILTGLFLYYLTKTGGP
jgi:hypothetical protein